MSNFAAIGFDGETPEEVQGFVAQAIDAGRPPAQLGAAADRHLWWHDDSGAGMAAHLGKGGEVECVTPFFVAPGGGTRWRVVTNAAHPDSQCRHCSGADCDILDPAGELLTRATVQWAFFEPYRHWLSTKREYELEVVAFASTLSLCATSEDLEQAQALFFGPGDTSEPSEPAKPMRLAEEALLPYGMFEHEGALSGRARVVLTGAVEAVAQRTNGLTGRRFTHARVRTLGGAIDVVAPASALPDTASKPKLAFADVWLVGRPCEPPPAPAPTSWFGKVFGGE